jgi:hypothetical protein
LLVIEADDERTAVLVGEAACGIDQDPAGCWGGGLVLGAREQVAGTRGA